MPEPFLAEITPRMMGWMFIGLSVLVFVWTMFNAMTGETSVEGNWSGRETIRQDEEPERFAKTIRVSMVGAFTMLVIGLYVLLFY